MLGRIEELNKILELNKQISEIQKQKWEVEDNLLKLEVKIADLEKKSSNSYVKDTSKPQLDFSGIKIPELEDRILNLVKYLPKSETAQAKAIQSQFNAYKKTYQTILNSLKKPAAQLEVQNKALRDNLGSLRRDINKIAEVKKKIETIAELDGLVSLKMLMLILEDIRGVNEDNIFNTLKLAVGKDLKAVTNKKNFTEIKKDMGINVKSIFEDFTKKTESTNVSEHAVHELMKTIVEKFLAAIQKKLQYKNIENPAAFAQFQEGLYTDIYLFCALETYSFTDDVQMGYAIPQATFAKWMNLRQVLNPYLSISFCAKQLKVAANTQEFFLELAYWLKGLYQRSVNQIPNYLKEGETITDSARLYIGDDEDRSLMKHKPPLTKYRMALNHEHHWSILSKKLTLEMHAPDGKQDKDPNATPEHFEPAGPIENIIDVYIPQPIHIEDSDCYRMTIHLSKDQQERLKRLRISIGKALGYGFAADEGEFRKELATSKDLSPDEKIKKLIDCIREYRLTDNQRASLRFIHLTANQMIPGYSEKSRYFVLEMYHAENARETINRINGTSDPSEQLKELYKFRKALIKQQSHTLLPIVEKVLLNAFDLLYDGPENTNHAANKAEEVTKEKHTEVSASQSAIMILEENYYKFIIELPKDALEKRSKLEVSVGKVIELGIEAEPEDIRKQLASYQNKTEEEKITILRDCLMRYELSDNQASSLIYLSSDVVRSFKSYMDSSRMLVFSRAHYGEAKKIVDEIEKTNTTSKAMDAKILLLLLFNLRKVLQQNSSKTLLTRLDTILLGAYETLSTSVVRKQSLVLRGHESRI